MKNKTQPYEVERWAMAQKLGSKTHAHKLLLLTLAVTADAGGYCFPSQRTLGDQCDLARQTVNEHLKWLEEHGHVASRARVAGGGRNTSKEYVLLFRPDVTWPDGTPAVLSEMTTATRHPVSAYGDADCQVVATGDVRCVGHLEETKEEPEEETPEETNARKRADGPDELFGLSEYITGLGERGVLKPEWAEQDFSKPEWQTAWSGYVSANGAEQVSADLKLLFAVMDEYDRPEIISRYRKGQRNWSALLMGRNSVAAFTENIEALRSTSERFGSVAVGANR